MLGITRLRAYVMRELLGPTLLGLLLYTFVLLMNAFFFVARTAIAKNLSWDLTLELFLLQIPKTLVLTIPMGTIFGVLMGLGRLSADHEWVAFQAAGLGPRFLLKSVVLHGVAATLASLAIYNVAYPHTNYWSRQLQNKVLMASNLASDLRPRVFYSEVPGLVVYANEIRPGTGGQLEGVWIYRSDPETRHEEIFLARRGRVYSGTTADGGLELDLVEGVSYFYRSADPESYQVSRFGRIRIPIAPPDYFRNLTNPPEKTVVDMTPRELLEDLERSKRQPDPVLRELSTQRTVVELHQRLALPLAALAFALLGLPLGVGRIRSGKGAGFALSLAVIAVYWLIFTTTAERARLGRASPFLGIWAANLCALIWAGAAYTLMRRRGARESIVVRWFREFARRDWAFRRTEPVAAPLPVADPETPRGRPDTPSRRRWVGFALLDRYIGLQYVRVFLLAMMSAYLLYAVVEFKNLLDDLANTHQPISLVLRYFQYFAPGMLNLVLPIACLIGAVVTFTVLGKRGELTGMKAGGISMRRATFPVIVLTLLTCGAAWLVQEHLAPDTNRKAQEVKDKIQGRMPRTYGMATVGRWTFGSGGRLYHYGLFDPGKAAFQDLSVLTLDWSGPRIVDHRYSRAASWNGRTWVLRDGWYHRPPTGAWRGDNRTFETEEQVLDPPENFSRRESLWSGGSELPEQMSLEDLALQIDLLRHSGYDTTRLEVAYHAKVAHPFTPMVMVLLGLPFAFRMGRRGSLYSVGVALVLVVVYWATLAIFEALGLETMLPPVLAAWAPNVLYGLSGLYLLLFIRT